jgi:hypothetical protein
MDYWQFDQYSGPIAKENSENFRFSQNGFAGQKL